MSYTKIDKPTGSDWTNIAKPGDENYTSVSKPTGIKKIIRGMITGLVIPLTYAKDYIATNPWTNISKPT